jgi:hypothetical protein
LHQKEAKGEKDCVEATEGCLCYICSNCQWLQMTLYPVLYI